MIGAGCGKLVIVSRKKPSSAVATTVDGANLVSCPFPYNQVPVSLSTSSPYNSVQLPVSSSIGTMGVSANITSLPQPAPIILPQTTDHSTDQVPQHYIHLKLNIKLLKIDFFNYLTLFAKLHTYGSSKYTRTCHNEQTCSQMNKRIFLTI
jgi:hypothetical protein